MTSAEKLAADATRLAAHNARLRESRIAARAAAGLPPIHGRPAAPLVTSEPAPVAPLPPDPARLVFERVRAAALTRIAAEERAAAEALAARQAAQQAEDDAVNLILASARL